VPEGTRYRRVNTTRVLVHSVAVPAHVVWAVSGTDAELPCDVTPPTPKDRINMVLWFKDSSGIPLYR
jgi:hypothetical protein